MADGTTPGLAGEAQRFHAMLQAHPTWFVLTGAGCSTASGIPAYRDARGRWKHEPPMTFSTFMGDPQARQRYWARSFRGYPRLQRLKPNAAHNSLAKLEALGRVELLVTQNVDGLHQRAGSQSVVELHGSIHQVVCTACGARSDRSALQQRLADLNPEAPGDSLSGATETRPDGDAHVAPSWLTDFVVPQCKRCEGILKPAVTFFGEGVPRHRVDHAYAALARVKAMLIVGTSLTLLSGHRFARRAGELGLTIVVVNRGTTRANPLATATFDANCEDLLNRALRALPRLRAPRSKLGCHTSFP